MILSGSSSTTCGDTLVQCYTGIDYVRGYDATAVYSTTTGPAVTDATLTPGTCSDAWFAGSTCTVGFSAAINIGTHATGSALMKAVVAGTSYPLTYSATTGRWSTAGTPISIPAGAGQRPVTLSWELQDGTWNGNTCTTKGNNRCTGHDQLDPAAELRRDQHCHRVGADHDPVGAYRRRRLGQQP